MHARDCVPAFRAATGSGNPPAMTPDQIPVALGSDHAGVALKAALREALEAAGHPALDMGTNGPESVDYPDFANAVAESERLEMFADHCIGVRGDHFCAGKDVVPVNFPHDVGGIEECLRRPERFGNFDTAVPKFAAHAAVE